MRRAFTLVELVVTIAVIVFCFALILPLLPRNREQVNIVRCVNNLKMFALAVHNYSQTFHCVPPAGWLPLEPHSTHEGQLTASVHVRLLPFVQHTALYNAYNFEVGDKGTAGEVANATVMSTVVSTFLCPRDANPGNGNAWTSVGGQRFPTIGNTNYAINGGANRNNSGGKLNGAAWYMAGGSNFGAMVTLASVKDGTSHTALFSEHIKGGGGSFRRGTALVYNGAFASLNRGSPKADADACRALARATRSPNSANAWDYKGSWWTCQDSGMGGPYFHVMTPNQPACDAILYPNSASIRNWGGSGDVAASGSGPFHAESFIGPSSNHRAGAYFALMDGSVKFVRNSVALAPYASLGTTNGGEPIDLDAF